MSAPPNPLLVALAALPDDELAADLDLSHLNAPDIAAWCIELGWLLGAERLARHGGTRPTESNALVAATERLSRESFGLLLSALHALRQTLPTGPRRRFVEALGLLLAVDARTSGRFDRMREN